MNFRFEGLFPFKRSRFDPAPEIVRLDGVSPYQRADFPALVGRDSVEPLRVLMTSVLA